MSRERLGFPLSRLPCFCHGEALKLGQGFRLRYPCSDAVTPWEDFFDSQTAKKACNTKSPPRRSGETDPGGFL